MHIAQLFILQFTYRSWELNSTYRGNLRLLHNLLDSGTLPPPNCRNLQGGRVPESMKSSSWIPAVLYSGTLPPVLYSGTLLPHGLKQPESTRACLILQHPTPSWILAFWRSQLFRRLRQPNLKNKRRRKGTIIRSQISSQSLDCLDTVELLTKLDKDELAHL